MLGVLAERGEGTAWAVLQLRPRGRRNALVLDNPDGRAEFFRYESMLNVAADLPEVILCLYDLERYGAAVMMDVLQTHPRVIVNNTIHNNPDFIEPRLYLGGKPDD